MFGRKKEEIDPSLYRLLYRIAKSKAEHAGTPNEINKVVDPGELKAVIGSDRALKKAMKRESMV